GFGNYQRIEDIIRQFPIDEVLPSLLDSLKSDSQSTLYWCTQISTYFPHPALIEPLKQILLDPKNENDVRFFAASSMEGIDDIRVSEIFRQSLLYEPDKEIKEIMAKSLYD